MSRIAIIPARGGSKRIPRKNIKIFFGKPVIAYSIEAAIQSGLFDEVMVSTDDDEIAQIAIQYGAKIPFMRSDVNSNDFASTAVVIEEVLNYYKSNNIQFDAFCCIYPIAPLITSKMLADAYQIFTDNFFDSVFTVQPFNSPIQRAFASNKNKIKMIWPENCSFRSQDLSKTYHDAGQFYWMRSEIFFNSNNFFTDNSGFLELEEYEAQDIDSDFDWKLVQFKYKLSKEKQTTTNFTNKIILGTAQFGMDYGINNSIGKLQKENVKDILDFAFESNIFFLDTAEAYGDSQEIIGHYHESSINRFNIVTKFCPKRMDLPEDLNRRIRKNIDILNVDSLYGYLFHSIHDFKKYYFQYQNEIEELKREGLIKKIGVSVYTNDEVEELLEHNFIDLIQLPFNLFDNKNKRSSIINKAKERGIEIHARSIFLQGLIFKSVKDLPEKVRILQPYFNEINRISKMNNLDLKSLSLNYVNHQKNIDNIVIGVDSVEQLKEDMLAFQNEIPDEVIKQIDSIDVKEEELLYPYNWK